MRENHELRVNFTHPSAILVSRQAWQPLGTLDANSESPDEREAMKILHPSQRGFGFTFPDVVLVLLAVILLVLFPPGLRLRQPYTDQRSHCVSNLKQVGLALLYSANDNGNKLKR